MVDGLASLRRFLPCRYTEMMPHIVKASKVAAATCKDLFMDQRWNCSAIETAPQLSPDLTLGTREQAFVHALASAAVAYSVSKACASGTVFYCTCGRVPSEPPNGSFQWGGCGDNLKYGLKLSQTFVDAPDRVKRVRRSLTALTNRHNNRAGRKALRESQVTECKCHGVSGSCNIRTCWKALARLDVIGRRLKKKYATAMEVTGQGPASTDRRLRLLPVSPIRGLYNEEDLIYTVQRNIFGDGRLQVHVLRTRIHDVHDREDRTLPMQVLLVLLREVQNVQDVDRRPGVQLR
ncbi:unnamed protein product [Darwinula stevensoni]|uniref:Protein Wnt n=1 Tax=Darwinula stevensoni TaxID=69355 RepID=A0A7R9A8T4_9CRUS|nr:unnamed protein product [Darwinula stevensoni]CAG0896621.1 unnamed protein product [Darwinula stevensoni]